MRGLGCPNQRKGYTRVPGDPNLEVSVMVKHDVKRDRSDVPETPVPDIPIDDV